MKKYIPIDPTIKEAAHRRAKGRCERCGSRGSRANWELHVHHLTYERAGREELSDVEVLCLGCHNAQHPHRTFSTKRNQIAAKKKRAKRKKKGGRWWDGMDDVEAYYAWQKINPRAAKKGRKTKPLT